MPRPPEGPVCREVAGAFGPGCPVRVATSSVERLAAAKRNPARSGVRQAVLGPMEGADRETSA